MYYICKSDIETFQIVPTIWNFSISLEVLLVLDCRDEISNICLVYLFESGVSSGRTPRSYGTGLAHPSTPRFSELEDRSHRIVRPFSLSHAGYPRSRASYTRITWRGSRPRVRWPAALQGRSRAVLPNTTSDDAANAAIIVGQSYDADRRAENGTLVSTGHVDNSREVIVDAQLYRLSSSEWRHSQPPRFDVFIGGYGNSNTIFEIRGPTRTYYNKIFAIFPEFF